jgi:hypothetical protein
MTRLLLGAAGILLVLVGMPAVIGLRPDTGHLLRTSGTASLLTSDVSLVPWSWPLAATTLLVGLAAVGWGSLLRRLLRLPDAGVLGLLARLPAGIAALATALTLLAAPGLLGTALLFGLLGTALPATSAAAATAVLLGVLATTAGRFPRGG